MKIKIKNNNDTVLFNANDDPTYENYIALLTAIFAKEDTLRNLSLKHLENKEEADKRIQYLDQNYYKKGELPPLAKWYKEKDKTPKKKITQKERYHAYEPVLVKNIKTGVEEVFNERIHLCKKFNINLVTLNYYVRLEKVFDNKYIFYDLRENNNSNKKNYNTCNVTVENIETGEEKEYKNIKSACIENGIHYGLFQKARYKCGDPKEFKYKNFIFKNLPKKKDRIIK